MNRLLLSRCVQHQLGKLAAIVARLDVQHKVLIRAELVGAQRVGANVLILRALQRETGAGRCRLSDVQVELAPRKTGRVVLLSVDFFVDKEDTTIRNRRADSLATSKPRSSAMLPTNAPWSSSSGIEYRICARTRSTTQAHRSRHMTSPVTGTQLPLECL
uniref:Uncharacterized protein n=1 Tax=Cynoglossus semilaevis TaxID=244447 RepID=A0A3P8VBW8_CYNSE